MILSATHANDDVLFPAVFLRYHRQLRAVLIDRQVWFAAHDLGRLTNRHINTRIIQRLDADQWRWARLAGDSPDDGGVVELLISESGLYALLMVNLYHPENRSLRQWVSNEVVPILRDTQQHNPHLPRRRAQPVEGQMLGLLDWQGALRVRLVDTLKQMESPRS